MEILHHTHYIRTDAAGRITDGWSDGPHPTRDAAGAVCVNDQGGYQFRLTPDGEENPELYTGDDIPLYHWDGAAVVRRSEEEIQTDRQELVPPEPPASLETRVDALETETAAIIYVSRLQLAGEAVDTDDKRIRASGLYPDWAPGDHPKGEICNAAGQTWECFAPYDNAVYPNVKPGETAWYTFNRPLHGTSPETARPWCKPQHGTTDIYHPGEYMIWMDGSLYRCLRDTNCSPEEYPADWEIV